MKGRSSGSSDRWWRVVAGLLVAPLAPGGVMATVVVLAMVVTIEPKEIPLALVSWPFLFLVFSMICWVPTFILALAPVALLMRLKWRSKVAHGWVGVAVGSLVGVALAKLFRWADPTIVVPLLCGCALAGGLTGASYWALALKGVPPPSRPPPPPE